MPSARASDLRKVAPFSALADDALEALAEACPRTTYFAPDVVLPSETPAAKVGVVLSGELIEREGSRTTRVIHGPSLVGLAACIAGTPARELRAHTSTEVVTISKGQLDEVARAHPGFATALAVTLATEAEANAAELSTRRLRDSSGSFVGAGARVAPGPYVTEKHALYVFFMRDVPERISARLPPGLRPLPAFADTWFLVFEEQARRLAEFPPTGGQLHAPLEEAMAVIPCLGPMLRPAVYVVSMFTPGLFSLLSAREIHGLPARHGQVERHGQHFDLLADGNLVAQASWQGEAALDPTASRLGALGPPLARLGSALSARWAQLRTLGFAGPKGPLSNVPVFVHRQRGREVARPGGGDSWAVDQLAQIPLNIRSFEGLHALVHPRVEMNGVIDGLGGRATFGVSARVSFGWGAARERTDYRARSLFASAKP